MVKTSSAGLALMLAPLALMAACGDNDAADETVSANGTAAVGTAALVTEARLAAATDRSWINLSGTIVSKTPNSFILDYGDDTVTVEMDDWDWYREGQALASGDPVVVTGRVDDDLWQAKRIEASSVYARNLNTYFFASGADEEDLNTSTVYVPPAPPGSDTTGYVTAMEGQEFTIGSGSTAIRVDMSSLAQAQKPAIKIGDRVYVWGDLDIEPRERAEIMAKGIVLLAKDRTKMSGNGQRAAAGESGKGAAGNVQTNSAGTGQ